MVPDEKPVTPQIPDSLEDRLAQPLDRLAAVVADLVIISPVATLLMAPFRRIASEAMLQGRDDAWMIATLSAIGISVLLVILYQTYFLVKWRATPGKRLLGLTVESLWDQEGAPMQPQAAFMRACALCAELLLLGLPLIGIIGNDRRRPFHDRIADTIVLSKKRTSAGAPGVSEKSLASGLVAAFFMSILIIVGFKIGQLRFGTVLTNSVQADASASLCEEVGRAAMTWVPGLNEKKPSRIAIALSLYEAGAIGEGCLKTEADGALWAKGDHDLGYLARGLAEKSDDDTAQNYLDKACDGTKESDACRALSILDKSDLPEDPVEAKAAQVAKDTDVLALTTSLKPSSQPFLKILAVRELITRKQEARALELMDLIAPQRSLSYFLTSERAKILWSLDEKQKSRELVKSSVASLDSEERVALTRWFCYAETSAAGCSTAAKMPCDLLAASIANDKVLLGDPEVTLTYLRGEACADRLSEKRLAELKTDTPDLNSQNYIEALSQLVSGHEDKGAELLKAIAAKEETPFFVEAESKLARIAKSEKELSAVRESWIDTDPESEGWAYLGRSLMDRYNEFKVWDQTIEIGFKISESENLDQNIVRPMIVAAYRSGQTKMATGYWQTYFKKDSVSASSASTDRSPASTDGFDEVVKEIEAELAAPVIPKKLPEKPHGRVRK